MDLSPGGAMIAVEFVTQCLEIVKQVVGPWISHVFNIDDKRRHLKRKFEELESIAADNKTELQIAEALPWKRRKKEVDNWLTNVTHLRPKVRSIQQEGQNRWNLLKGKQIDKVTEEVKELIDSGKFQGGLVLDVLETGGDAFLVTKLVGKAFHAILVKISECLENDEVWMIGIYGMAGVGKTTLGIHFHNQLVESADKFVRWITVSQDFSIYDLQDQVAKVIHVDLSQEEDEMKRAARISKALAMRPRFVFIFDNLWNQFEPEKIGIRVGVNNCKMILLTRSLDVCRRMACQRIIKLKPLPEKESWNLFMEELGNVQALPADVKFIANLVVRKCFGLPLPIVALAKSLRGVDDICEWRDVLEKMEESEPGKRGRFEDEVLRSLRLSYNRLGDQILQSCFLYCALFPRNYKIKREDLIEYLIDGGILKGLKSRQAYFDRGHSMLNELENVCLLEGITERRNYRYVTMNNLVRDMAVQVMKETSKVMIAAGKRLKELPDESKWTEDLVSVSLMENDIQQITWSCSVRCPNLSTLLLCRNRHLASISNCFFKQFPGLVNLDLSHTAIKVLPSSVSNLVNLTSLLLRCCKQLWHIPSLAKLEKLTKLDLSATAVEEVPGGLEFLSILKYLDLYGSKIKGFRKGVLPRLSHLQLLMLGQAPEIEEVIRLRKLEYLRCHFRQSSDLVTYITQALSMSDSDSSTLPSNYDLFAGEDDGDLIAFVPDISMLTRQIVFRKCSIGTNGELVAIPKSLQMLYIISCHDACSLSSANLVELFTDLKFCEIEKCERLEYLISVPQFFSNIFVSLEILRLVALKTLCFLIKRDEVSPQLSPLGGEFSSLKRFEIFDCPSIKTLFPSSLLQNLQNLEEIVVAKCGSVEEIIQSAEDSITLSLPKLKLFKLAYLPELRGIGCDNMICNSIQEICVFECPKLKRMPLSLPLSDNGQPSPPPCLKRIMILPEVWWDAVEWDRPDVKDVLLPFKMVVHLSDTELDPDTLAEHSRLVQPSSESRNRFFSPLEFPENAQLDGSLVPYL